MKHEKALAFDANDAYFLDKELVAMQQEAFETLRSPFNSEILIPMYTDDPEGANYHEYALYDQTGAADYASDADNTFPVANATRENVLRKYVTKGISTLMTFQDTRASRMALLNMAQDKFNSALRAIRFAQNDMAFFGSPAHGIDGWLNAAGVEKDPVNGAPWSVGGVNKDPDAILQDMDDCVNRSLIATDGAVRVNRLVMPIAQYAYINSTPRSAGTDTTILQYFLMNHPDIDVFWANELKGAFPGGTDGMIAYEYNPSWFKNLVSIDFFARPTLNVENGFKTLYETRMGGVIVVYPESQTFRYGI